MAGTITGAITVIKKTDGKIEMAKIALTCTADSGDASYPATTINSLDGVSLQNITGLYLYCGYAAPGALAPTANSDITITKVVGSSSSEVDLLGGNGTNMITTTATSFPAGSAIADFAQPITGNTKINITNNIINSAVTYVELMLVSK